MVPDESPLNAFTELPKLTKAVTQEKAEQKALPMKGMNKVRSEAKMTIQKLDSVDDNLKPLQPQLPAKRLAPIARVD